MPPKQASNLEQLISHCDSIKSKVVRFNEFLKKCTPTNVVELTLRAKQIENCLEQFSEIQLQISQLTKKDNSELEEFENFFYNTLTTYTNFIKNNSNTITSEPMQVEQTNLRLPIINLPSFDGNYIQWNSFHETFNSLIHNNVTLNNIQRFHYLQSALKGEPLNLISSLPITSGNYINAWHTLIERYDNKRLIINNHIHELFSLPVITKNCMSLRHLLDKTQSHLRALRSLKQDVDNWDALIIYLTVSKLDFACKREWESTLKSNELPTKDQLFEFLKKRCQVAESLNVVSPEQKGDYFKVSPKRQGQKLSSNVSMSQKFQCNFCKGNHLIYNCPTFLELLVPARIEEIRKLKLCLNCLKKDHTAENCKSGKCRLCKERHNTLVHHTINLNYDQVEKKLETQLSSNLTPLVTSNSAMNPSNNAKTILSTAIINVLDKKGNNIPLRALLDSGSQTNFLTQKALEKLNIKPCRAQFTITGITQSVTSIKESARVTISSLVNSFSQEIQCLILPEITNNLPIVPLDINTMEIPEHVELADKQFYEPNQVDVLLGNGIFWSLLREGQIQLGKNKPTLQNTVLGWIVGGTLHSASHSYVHSYYSKTLENQISKFWELESYENKPLLTRDETLCENHFEEHHIRLPTGNFQVKLPFKKSNKELGNSLDQAVKRFEGLEKRFQREPNLLQEYSNFLKEYIQLGHMEEISPTNNINRFYFPHHAVFKPDSTTSKIRVVFDASAKSTTNVSLNDLLLIGPTLQSDLFSIILRFRLHIIAFTADIAKMYRQIWIHPDDRKFQTILWRDSPNEPLKHFQLNTVTYGTACAQYLAIKVLQTLAVQEGKNFPLAKSIILKDFYVDDLLTGADSVVEALKIKNQVTRALKQGGFELRKFASNSSNILDQNSSRDSMINIDKQTTKTLGLYWDTKKDIFCYSIESIKQPQDNHLSKRLILSTIARIFDPLGLIGPIFIRAKILLQKLWTYKLDWDEAVPLEIKGQWNEFVHNLHQIKNIEIPRNCTDGVSLSNSSCQLHGFCDSSELAYGAAIYLRCVGPNNITSVNLICAKSKVAPLKQVSLPRLELSGAVLLAKLMSIVSDILHVSKDNCYFWTDSTIVLSWLSSPPNTWTTFVANRTSEIQTLSNITNWSHVRGNENPADLISRGVSPVTLKNSTIWWLGPQWLLNNKDQWPQTHVNFHDPIPEKRNKCFIATSINEPSLFTRYSSWTTLLRVVAWCLRFHHNCKQTSNKDLGSLTVQEIENAKMVILTIIQKTYFQAELHNLLRGELVSRGSKLKMLNPFLDDSGLIRVGGRLRHSVVSPDCKFPILLPRESHVTQLIIKDIHVKQLHTGQHGTLAGVRQKYWPISGIQVVKKIIRNCIPCFKINPRVSTPIMGDLPSARLQPSRPFTRTGVDFAGPVFINEGRGRGKRLVKAYIVIFVCFTTKSFHLELAFDLSTQTFLNALHRFIARRGNVAHIYSDNGKNFVGANNELRSLLRSTQFRSQVINNVSMNSITWHFIPPQAPHFGGLWEAGVKSVKTHLKKILGNSHATFEEFYTLLTRIEAILNSRPLSPMSDDPNDFSILTPGHFLIGAPMTAPPENDVTETNVHRLTRWQHIENLRQHFWKRWTREYLTRLQQRSKWQKNSAEPIKIGSLVLLKEDNLPPLQWRLGRVEKMHPGPDGVTRVVSVRTNNGTLKRPVVKICLIPV